MDQTNLTKLSALKVHLISAGLTFASVFLPIFAISFNSGLPHETTLTGDLIISAIIAALRAAGKAALQATILEEETYIKKQINVSPETPVQG